MMKLETPRLIMRDISLLDIEMIHQLHSLPETDRYNTLGIPETKEVTSKLVFEWIVQQQGDPRTSFIFYVEEKGTAEFIGLMGMRLGKLNYRIGEVWYKTHLKQWGKGYTTEALKKLLDFCFTELKLHRIEAGCAVENIASVKVLEKVGMTREGRKRKILPIRGEWQDNFFYAMLEEDFLKQ